MLVRAPMPESGRAQSTVPAGAVARIVLTSRLPQRRAPVTPPTTGDKTIGCRAAQTDPASDRKRSPGTFDPVYFVSIERETDSTGQAIVTLLSGDASVECRTVSGHSANHRPYAPASFRPV
ncbi:hypothetical protein PCANC_19153 [Puccinia coronata f. sp. avenae]|uniref:Uncharacterized protein n=1 Tax=Puccinia coronata f. sp. avenae TaxID=200324 RepID=A0A2N5SGS8_9BASI|nr:hypothetical protein PCANC_19153 [Puccinia coronata f. sp. avenae]